MAASFAPPSFSEPVIAIVFDLDGTLIESHHDFPRMRKSVVQLAEKYGVMPGKLSVTDPVPHLVRDALTLLEQGPLPEGPRFRFESELNTVIDAIEMEALPRTQAIPHAATLLKALTDQGYRLGLLTRSSERFTVAALRQTGLASFFPFLRSRSAPGPAKPSPEALHLLLRTMDVPADRAVLVGDHLLDCECAVAARVPFYAVLFPPTDSRFVPAERFRAKGATAVARDLVELGRFLGVMVSATSTTPAA